jgi:hypothetical protein
MDIAFAPYVKNGFRASVAGYKIRKEKYLGLEEAASLVTF